MARKLLLGFAVLVLIASLAGVVGLGFLYYRLNTQLKSTDQVRTRLAVLNSIFIPTITGEIFTMTEAEALVMFQAWTNNVEAVNDPTLSQKFHAYLERTDQDFNEFLVYLLGSMEDVLR